MNQDILIILIGTLISTIGVVLYIRDSVKGMIKPHPFTWFIWSLIQSIAFGIQVTNDGGIGSFIMFWYALSAGIIFLISLKYAKTTISKLDYLFLGLALLSIVLWLVFNSPIISITLLILIDILAFIPTVRKSFNNPNEEAIQLYLYGNIGLISSLLTLEIFTFVNYGYPLFIVVINFIFIFYLFLRRKLIKT